MTVCGRGCCFTGLQVCARAYSCACHWADKRPASERGDAYRHADPTARQAIKNIMRERKKHK